MTDQNSRWLNIALDAMNIAFNKDSILKNNLSESDKQKAIRLLKECIDIHGANEAWPFIKLADLVDNNEQKMCYYLKSLKYEETIYAYKYIYQHIINFYPEIVEKYLDEDHV